MNPRHRAQVPAAFSILLMLIMGGHGPALARESSSPSASPETARHRVQPQASLSAGWTLLQNQRVTSQTSESETRVTPSLGARIAVTHLQENSNPRLTTVTDGDGRINLDLHSGKTYGLQSDIKLSHGIMGDLDGIPGILLATGVVEGASHKSAPTRDFLLAGADLEAGVAKSAGDRSLIALTAFGGFRVASGELGQDVRRSLGMGGRMRIRDGAVRVNLELGYMNHQYQYLDPSITEYRAKGEIHLATSDHLYVGAYETTSEFKKQEKNGNQERQTGHMAGVQVGGAF